jgi:hypothetical protein
MISRGAIRKIASVVLAALLFAQAAVAAASCDMPDRAPAQVFSRPAPMPCHEEPAQNANICLAHCLSADQSADTPQVVVHAFNGTAPLNIAVDEGRIYPAAALRYKLPRPAAPPPRILFQTFLI